jgi:hypothetical protein
MKTKFNFHTTYEEKNEKRKAQDAERPEQLIKVTVSVVSNQTFEFNVPASYLEDLMADHDIDDLYDVDGMNDAEVGYAIFNEFDDEELIDEDTEIEIVEID